ncbi:MAG: FAD-dependent thymidylate synthase [Desulfurococcales archaeon]|nr:FAD-dependent thymidylate synthase [Desulfurococcales archaeon]
MGVRVEVVRFTNGGDRIIAAAAKRSLSRRDLNVQLAKMSDEEVDIWVRETLKRQHFSPWEHSVYTWTVEGCSRVCSHQLVRHRIASFTQLSLRYAKLGFDGKCLDPNLYRGKCVDLPVMDNRSLKACWNDDMITVSSNDSQLRLHVKQGFAFIDGYRESGDSLDDALLESWFLDMIDNEIPRSLGRLKVPLENVYRRYCRMIDFVIPPSIASRSSIASDFIRETSRLFLSYRKMISKGIPPEDARFIVPMGVQTKLVITMNARELIQSFLPLRMCTKAQWEIRIVAWLLWKKLQSIHPKLFRYAGPRCILYENAIRQEPMTLAELINGKNPIMERCPENIEKGGIPKCVRSNILFLQKMGYHIDS